jgi:pimeloyl-ACP methyl ester carboxylesterase
MGRTLYVSLLLVAFTGATGIVADAQPVDRFINVNGIELHYLEWGEASNPPIIMLHGIGRIAHSFSHIADHFADDYHVMAVDMRGHGDSGWSPDGAYFVRDYVSDIEAMAEEMDLQNIVIWGNSTGGRVAQMFAGMQSDRMAAVIVEDVGPERPTSIANRLAGQIARDDANGWASVEELTEQLLGQNSRTRPEVTRAYARFGSKQRDDGRIVWKRDPAIGNDFVPLQHWPYIRQIASPIIYILGGNSSIVPVETQVELRRVLPQVELVTMPGLGHYPSEENPEEFLEIVDEFLAGTTR